MVMALHQTFRKFQERNEVLSTNIHLMQLNILAVHRNLCIDNKFSDILFLNQISNGKFVYFRICLKNRLLFLDSANAKTGNPARDNIRSSESPWGVNPIRIIGGIDFLFIMIKMFLQCSYWKNSLFEKKT